MYDPERYAGLGAGASEQYVSALLVHLPARLARAAKARGGRDDHCGPARFPVELTSGNSAAAEAGLAALARALEREEAASE